MINIITRSFESINGPNKVVKNLVKGLDKIKYPYVINKSLNSTQMTYIPNRISSLTKIHKSKSKIIVGPNLYIVPKEIPFRIDLTNCLYILPSEWNYKQWNILGFDRCSLRIWAAGIDTDEFCPIKRKKDNNFIMVYHKERNPDELKQIENVLKNLRINYSIIYYGNYPEEYFKELLQKSTFVIWHGRHESQGFALQEALAMDVPILVCDVVSVFDQYQVGYKYSWNEVNKSIPATAAPYFNENCGMKIKVLSQLEEAIEFMLSNLRHFTPRDYVLDNISLEGQAKKLIELYEYWGISYNDGFSEKLIKIKEYSDPLFYQVMSFGKKVLRR